MKKIPCLFVRKFDENRKAVITRKVTPGCEWVLDGEGVATIKYDGTACMAMHGEIYKRYDAKHGKKPPVGAIPCQEPDPVTGHWPHWVLVESGTADNDRYLQAAYRKRLDIMNELVAEGKSDGSWIPRVSDGTYELCGPTINRNPQGYPHNLLIKHGEDVVVVERSFDGIKKYLEDHYVEGLVFHRENGDMCKIRRKDFGLPWNVKQ